ncbi:MAG: HSP20 family small heat-shock protein [Polyangia bacterium]
MTNLVRKENSQTPTRSGVSPWDPFRVMESLLGRESLFGREGLLGWEPALLPLSSGGTQGFAPRFDVKETKDSYVFTADLPGIKEEDLDISLTGNQLVVSGKREQESNKETERFHLYERTHGRFSRIFTLPDGVNPDQVAANLKDGVLTLTVGKKPEVQPRKISLSTKAQGSA